LNKTQKSGATVGTASSDNKQRRNVFIAEEISRYNDDSGESDLAYFRARPEARTRIRSAFPNEFPRKIMKQGRGRQAVVIVAVERNSPGEPTTRARGVLFPEGGTA